VAKWCVLEQKLLLATCNKSHNEESIGTEMNEHDLCIAVIGPMDHYVTFAIFVRDGGLVPKDHQ